MKLNKNIKLIQSLDDLSPLTRSVTKSKIQTPVITCSARLRSTTKWNATGVNVALLKAQESKSKKTHHVRTNRIWNNALSFFLNHMSFQFTCFGFAQHAHLLEMFDCLRFTSLYKFIFHITLHDSWEGVWFKSTLWHGKQGYDIHISSFSLQPKGSGKMQG